MKAAIKYVIDRFGPIAPGLVVFVTIYSVLELVGIFVFDLPPGSAKVVAATFLCMLIISIPLREWHYRTQKLWLPHYISPEERSAINSSVFRSLIWILLIAGISALAIIYEVVPVGYGFAGAVMVGAFFASFELRKSTANA